MSQITNIKPTEEFTHKMNSTTSIAISNFLYALKSPESKRQYPKRLKMFFDFDLNRNLSLDKQANSFLKQASTRKNGIQWATQFFIRFLIFQKERVEKAKIQINSKFTFNTEAAEIAKYSTRCIALF